MNLKVCMCVVAVLSFCVPARGAIWYVDVSNTSGTENGLTWETAFTTIQPAIDAADSDGGGEVWVAEGTYDENRPASSTGALILKGGVDLYGGFNASEAAITERNWKSNPTLIDGAVARGGQKAYHVVIGDSDVILDGFVILNGKANGTYPNLESLGGGIYLDSASKPVAELPFTVINCSITQNEAFMGGAVYINTNSVMNASNCAFISNVTGNNGGAIYNFEGTLKLDKCMVASNQAYYGGGIYAARTPMTQLTNCVFADNDCSLVGGGICIDQSTSLCTVANCTFWGNSASDGGAVCGNNSATVSVVNSIAWNNTGTYEITGINVSVDYCDIEDRAPSGHNIQADPLFIGADLNDFRLQGSSPCLDAGTQDGAPEDDFRGVERPQILGVDMGAYEMCVETLASRCGAVNSDANTKEARGDAVVFAILLSFCWIGTHTRKRKV
ncbi:MAG: hypothetical protein K1Y02_24740 [Candidatus Hydrogenedentes bacterium]|nr:hypothetical protein [Candidatus Hydrogenedentota bacterium]